MSFDDLQNQPDSLWSLLLHTGYLTLTDLNDKCNVRLPNKEITLLIKNYVDNWFTVYPFFK